MDIQIITPPVADLSDPLAHGLVGLTEAISQIDQEKIAHGALGGEFGYGADYDNPVFMMHHFCWCERDECPWCGGCNCPDPAPRYFIDGREVSQSEQWEWAKELIGPTPHEKFDFKHDAPGYDAYSVEWYKRIDERDRRSSVLFAARTHVCGPRGMMTDRSEGPSWKPSQQAPNFWHKSTGLKVWWYKWIGRDMEFLCPPAIDLQAVFSECLSSLPTNPQ